MNKLSVPPFFRKNLDWLIVGIITSSLVVICGWVYLGSVRGKTPSSERPRTFGIYPVPAKVVPPDPKFPPPAEQQLPFDQVLNVGNVGMELFWADRNVNRNSAVGAHKFILKLHNNMNSVQVISPPSTDNLNVGCIAVESPYRTKSVPAMKPITLQPYEKRDIELRIDVSCLYLGTADGKYFWRIY